MALDNHSMMIVQTNSVQDFSFPQKSNKKNRYLSLTATIWTVDSA